MEKKKNLEKMPHIDEVDGSNLRALLSANLKWFRSLQNISQLSLATRAGLTHNFINDIENCKRWVSPQTITKLATVLKIEPYQLFLPEMKAEEPRSRRFSDYLDDFTDSLHDMMTELRRKYLQDDDAESKTALPGEEKENATE